MSKGSFAFSVTPRGAGIKMARKHVFATDAKLDLDQWLNSLKAQAENFRDLQYLGFNRSVSLCSWTCCDLIE